jgi:hypothetical protein
MRKLQQARKHLILVTISLMAFFPIGSCDLVTNLVTPVNCYECFVDKPSTGIVELSLTIDPENLSVPVTIYLGSFEDNRVAYTGTYNLANPTIRVNVDVEYTVRAEYVRNGRTYYVVNKLHLKVWKDTESCNEPCYYFVNNEVDLRLKF